jgi:phosphate starvation-inducible PhoH-like protein
MVTKRRQKNAENEEAQRPRFVTPKTMNQKAYVSAIDNYDVVFCTGPSGTGKSFIAAGMAAEKLYREEIDQIIVTRPLVCSGKDLGALPGEVDMKIMPYLSPMEENFKFFLKNHYRLLVNAGKILYKPLELMRGATFHRSYMILDEAQNCTTDQIKMFITRMGQGSKVLINGDVKQTDLYNDSGLSYCIKKLKSVDSVAFATFNYDDIQRNGIIGEILYALEGPGDYNN